MSLHQFSFTLLNQFTVWFTQAGAGHRTFPLLEMPSSRQVTSTSTSPLKKNKKCTAKNTAKGEESPKSTTGWDWEVDLGGRGKGMNERWKVPAYLISQSHSLISQSSSHIFTKSQSYFTKFKSYFHKVTDPDDWPAETSVISKHPSPAKLCMVEPRMLAESVSHSLNVSSSSSMTIKPWHPNKHHQHFHSQGKEYKVTVKYQRES